ncbi:MAG: phosphatidylglycerol lysyltransferase domain-containing protein, partial [Caulobacteraceae bacterium]
MRPIEDLKPALLQLAPTLLALLVGAAGVMLLVSGATPSEPERFRWLAFRAPLVLIEASHFLSSIAGLGLVLLALGLNQRLDAAWYGSALVTAAAAALALLKGFNYEETVILGVVFLALLPFHAAFPRQARLSRMEIKPGWLLSLAAMVAGAGLLGWWTFHNVDYRGMQWWRVMADADADRAIRATAGAGIFLLVIGVWRLFASAATPKIVSDDDPALDKVRAILTHAEVMSTDAHLALLGDKRFLFSPSGESFLMFGVRGRSWIAMTAPAGRRDEQSALLWRFRELADAHAARPGFYGFGPELLPD